MHSLRELCEGINDSNVQNILTIIAKESSFVFLFY